MTGLLVHWAQAIEQFGQIARNSRRLGERAHQGQRRGLEAVEILAGLIDLLRIIDPEGMSVRAERQTLASRSVQRSGGSASAVSTTTAVITNGPKLGPYPASSIPAQSIPR